MTQRPNTKEIVERLLETAEHADRSAEFPLSWWLNQYPTTGDGVDINFAEAALLTYAMGRIYSYKVDRLEDMIRSIVLADAAARKNAEAMAAANATGDAGEPTAAAAAATAASTTPAKGGRRRRVIVQTNDDDDVDLTPAPTRVRPPDVLCEQIATADASDASSGNSSSSSSSSNSATWYERIAAQTASNRPLSYRRNERLQRCQTSAAAATFGRRRLHKRLDDDIDFPCNYAVFTQCTDVLDGSHGDAALALRVPDAAAMLPGDRRRRPFPMFRSPDYMRATFDLSVTCMGAEYANAMRGNAEIRALMRLDEAELIAYQGGRHLHAIQCGCDPNADDAAQRLSYGTFAAGAPDDTLPAGESTRLPDGNNSTLNNSSTADISIALNEAQQPAADITTVDAQQRMLDITPPPSPAFNCDDAEVKTLSSLPPRLNSIDEGIGASPVSDMEHAQQVQSLCRRVSVHLHDCMKGPGAQIVNVAGLLMPQIAEVAEQDVKAFVEKMFPVDERLVVAPVPPVCLQLAALPQPRTAPTVVHQTTGLLLPEVPATDGAKAAKEPKVRRAKRKADAADWDSDDLDVAGYDGVLKKWISTCDERFAPQMDAVKNECSDEETFDLAGFDLTEQCWFNTDDDRLAGTEKTQAPMCRDVQDMGGCNLLRTDSGYDETGGLLSRGSSVLATPNMSSHGSRASSVCDKSANSILNARASCGDSGFEDGSSAIEKTVDDSAIPGVVGPQIHPDAEKGSDATCPAAAAAAAAADGPTTDSDDDDNAELSPPPTLAGKDEEFAQRVSDWHRSLRAKLEHSERQIHFDIHEFGRHIIAALERRPEAKATFAAVLADVLQNAEQSGSMARTFLSTLELVNAGKVRLANANGGTERVTEYGDLTIDLVPREQWSSTITKR